MNDLQGLLRLVAHVDPARLRGDLGAACLAAAAEGASAILLGCGSASAREQARDARIQLSRLKVPLLLAGRADVAIAVGAAGVQLDPHDVPAAMVRRVAPRGFLIGAVVGSIADADNGRGADYWAIGPWSGLGTRGFSALLRRAEGRPCLAIGGVEPRDLEAVVACGGVGLVVRRQE